MWRLARFCEIPIQIEYVCSQDKTEEALGLYTPVVVGPLLKDRGAPGKEGGRRETKRANAPAKNAADISALTFRIVPDNYSGRGFARSLYFWMAVTVLCHDEKLVAHTQVVVGPCGRHFSP